MPSITILSNKAQVGIFFASKGLNDINEAKSIMFSITGDYATVISALIYIESLGNAFLDGYPMPF